MIAGKPNLVPPQPNKVLGIFFLRERWIEKSVEIKLHTDRHADAMRTTTRNCTESRGILKSSNTEEVEGVGPSEPGTAMELKQRRGACPCCGTHHQRAPEKHARRARTRRTSGSERVLARTNRKKVCASTDQRPPTSVA